MKRNGHQIEVYCDETCTLNDQLAVVRASLHHDDLHTAPTSCNLPRPCLNSTSSMPLYEISHTCVLSPEQQEKIAKGITDLHCTTFSAPAIFVNVVFHRYDDSQADNGEYSKAVFVGGKKASIESFLHTYTLYTPPSNSNSPKTRFASGIPLPLLALNLYRVSTIPSSTETSKLSLIRPHHLLQPTN